MENVSPTRKTLHSLSERLVPLGVMGDLIEGTPRYDSAVMYRGPQLGLHNVERR